ncbi:MAG: esterase/lipase family protein [Aeoliella sp.]
MNRREFQHAIAGLLTAGGMAASAFAAGKPRRPRSFLNLRTPTSGGQQLWADVRLFHEWRIQRNALTGHFRLVDGDNQRLAWGTLEACEGELETVRKEQQLTPMKETAVMLLHGLFRTRGSMSRLAAHLKQQTDWQVLNVGYPSTRGSIADHANALAQIVDHLDGVKKIHFVAHSLGNLVIRHWLGDIMQSDASDEIKEKDKDRRLGRIAMLGPPNQRPALAQALVPIDRHNVIAGDAGRELHKKWGDLSLRLATPPCEFGILAGGLDDGSGHNPLIPGDDDMIVGVDETKLTGARDFRVLPVIHATMMDDQAVQQMALKFLQEGFFESADERQRLG